MIPLIILEEMEATITAPIIVVPKGGPQLAEGIVDACRLTRLFHRDGGEGEVADLSHHHTDARAQQ